MFYNQAKKKAIEKLKNAQDRYQRIAEEGNDIALSLYATRKSAAKAIERVENYINTLANTPKEFLKEVAQVRLDINDFTSAMKLEEEAYNANIKGAGVGVAGVAAGGAIAALGPTAAMAIATTYGTASTGVAISALSGAAANSAALAWLGGGALATGGGGMAAGNALLALAGPIGWSVAGVLVVGGGIFAAHKNKDAAEKAEKIALEIEEKLRNLEPKLRKMKQLLEKTNQLKKGLDITMFVNTYPNDYNKFSEEQKKSLVALINNTKSMGILINERIK